MNYESLTTAHQSTLEKMLRRLDRLEAYLREDPNNASLMVEAFETALTALQWDRAHFHMRHALALDPESLVWSLREADFWLAQRKHHEASEVLDRLGAMPSPPAGLADAVLHNLALIDFQSKNYAHCVSRLESRMQYLDQRATPMTGGETAAGLSVPLMKLWLRGLHHAGELDRAVQWVLDLSAVHLLPPDLAGIASLIALDSQRFDLAGEWSETALVRTEAGAQSMEALVAQASLALAKNDAVKARELAFAALQINPGDGRSWSTFAFADLLAGDAARASQHFERALQAMPDHIGTWHGMGWSQLVQRKMDSARSSFESALALDRNFAESHGGLAVVLALENDVQGAREHVERALRLDPGNLSGRFAQAILKGEINNPDAFQELVHRLLSHQARPLGGGSMWDSVMQSMNVRDGVVGPE